MDLFFNSLKQKQKEINQKSMMPLIINRLHFNQFMNEIYCNYFAVGKGSF
jgi:predicted ATPase